MTIIIAVATPEGALLVADGRITQTWIPKFVPGSPEKPTSTVIDDRKQKITQITPTFAVGRLGVETHQAGHGPVVDLMCQCPLPDNAEGISKVVCEAVSATGTILKANLPVELHSNPGHKVGLAGAGISRGKSFVTACVYGPAMAVPDSNLSITTPAIPIVYIVFGGEDCTPHSAQDDFNSRVNSLTDYRLGSFINAAEETIRYAGGSEKGIGGQLRYWSLRHNQQAIRGSLGGADEVEESSPLQPFRLP